MATLTNTQISVTYVGLLKTSGNTILDSTPQQITDGSGNNSQLFLSTTKVGVGATPSGSDTLQITGTSTSVAYIDNSGRFSRLNEMANIAREGEPNIVEVSKVVPSLLPNDIDLLTNSRENALILLGKTGTNTVFGYKYLNVGDKRQQAAWFKWKLNKNLIYHFIIDDEYFILDSDYYLQSMQLVESTEDLSITQDGVDYNIVKGTIWH